VRASLADLYIDPFIVLEIRDVRKRQDTELFDCGLRLYSNPPALVLFQRAIAGEGHGGLRLLEDQVLATVWVFFCWPSAAGLSDSLCASALGKTGISRIRAIAMQNGRK
jgi:hypothetical protein